MFCARTHLRQPCHLSATQTNDPHRAQAQGIEALSASRFWGLEVHLERTKETVR
jgi:hypothetical protein